MIFTISTLLLILEFYFSFKKPINSLIISAVILFFIPFVVKFNFMGINLNVFNLSTSIILLCLLKNKKLQIDSQFKKYYILTFLYFFCTSFFCSLNSFTTSTYIKNIVLNFLELYCIGYCMMFIFVAPPSIKKFNRVIIYSSILIGLYGFFNYISKSNPYILYVCSVTDSTDMITGFLNEQRGVILSRVSSTFVHPLIYGEVMLLTICYLSYQLYEKIKFKYYITLIIFLFVSAILCGSRSTIIPLFLIPFIYLSYVKRKYIIGYLILFLSFIPILSIVIPQQYQESFENLLFFWNENNQIGGSSKSLRIEQLKTSLNIIEDSPLFGKGIGYIKEFGDKHPDMYGYESVVFQTLIEYGIIGSFIFFLFYYFLFNFLYNKTRSAFEKSQVVTLCGCYLICIIFTGISYSTFSYFLLLYFMTYYSLRGKRKQDIVKIKTKKCNQQQNKNGLQCIPIKKF